MSILINSPRAVAHNPRSVALARAIQASTGRFYVSAAEELTDPAAAPFATMRYRSTLSVDPRFAMTKDDLNSGFMFFYQGKMRGKREQSLPALTWLALAANMVNLQGNLQHWSVTHQKTVRDLVKSSIAEVSSMPHSARLTYVEEANGIPAHYLVDYPVVPISKGAILAVSYATIKDMLNPNLEVKTAQETYIATVLEALRSGVLNTPHKIRGTDFMRNNVFMTEATRKKLAAMSARGEYLEMFTGNSASGPTLFLRFKLPVTLAEKLTQTDADEIRPQDVYTLVQRWCVSRMGGNRQTKTPLRSRPLTSIAQSIPNDVKPLTNDDGIVLTGDNTFLYLPSSLNNIADFDSATAESIATKDPHVFCAYKEEDNYISVPPKNQPLLIDWLNLRFAYSDSDGSTIVMNLNRSVTPSQVHYRRLFNEKLNTDTSRLMLSLLVLMLAQLGIAPGLRVDPKWIPQIIAAVKKTDGEDGWKQDDADWDSFFEAMESPSFPRMSDSTRRIMNAMETTIHRVYAECVLQTNPQLVGALYKQWSVSTVHTLLAYITILAKHGRRRHEIAAEAREQLASYRDQDKVDPNFEPDSMPYLVDDENDPDAQRFVLPHQKRCMGKLSVSSNFAVLNVAAGGGKTTLCVTDILTNLKKGKIKRTLILCPAHLVPQYLDEFAYFTRGRINVIGINTYTMKRHGLDGLERILRACPPNTVVVADYNMANSEKKAQSVGYGAAATFYYPVVEMLRAFSFDYVFLDEVHYLRNPKSRIYQALGRLLPDIPMKRLASGTLTPNNVLDLVAQVALLDPSIFGTPQEFGEKFLVGGGTGKDGKMSSKPTLRPGAEKEIMALLKSRATYVTAQRKEWAACLPRLVEEGHSVELTPQQRLLYERILAQSLKAMTEEALGKTAEGKAMAKLLGLTKKEGEEDNDEDADSADGEESSIEALMSRHLARLETFMSAPGFDPLADGLPEEDRVSPKVAKILEICRNHIAQGIPGKIIIFCNYTNSARAIYEGMQELKDQTIFYTAGEKEKCVAQLQNDPSKMIMVGIEKSMNTGLNLQVASRLIRSDSVWTPGALEQGNARILRPNVKAAEFRTHVYIDWVLVNRSIDLIKSAFLFTKRVQVEKLENAGNPLYDSVEVPPLFNMSVDSIADTSNADSEFLLPYFQSYEQIEKARLTDYANYRAANTQDWTTQDVMLPNGETVQVVQLNKHRIRKSPPLPHSKLLRRLPYVPGSNIYAPSELGLKRYDQFMKYTQEELDELENSLQGDGDDDEAGDVGKATLTAARNRDELRRMGDLGVHTEYGDGTITRVMKSFVSVQLADGSIVKVHKLTAYVITRAQTSPTDIREGIIRSTGDIPNDLPPLPPPEVKAEDKPVVPKRVPKTVPADVTPPTPQDAPEGDSGVAEEPRAPRAPRAPRDPNVPRAPRAPRALKHYGLNLQLMVVNDFVGLRFDEVQENPDGAKFLQRVGFRAPQPCYVAPIKDAAHMLALFEYWHKKKYLVHSRYQAACVRTYTQLRERKKAEKHLVGLATDSQINNFFRLLNRGVEDDNVLCPYPLIIDDALYIALPNKAHPATLRAIRLKVPGISWMSLSPGRVLQKYFLSLRSASTFISKLVELPNVTLMNTEELLKQFKRRNARVPALMDGVRQPKAPTAPVAPQAPGAVDVTKMKIADLRAAIPEDTLAKLRQLVADENWDKLKSTLGYYRKRNPHISEYARRALKKHAAHLLD